MGLFDLFKKKELTPREVQEAVLQYMGGGLVVPQDNAISYITNGYNTNVVVHSAVRYITRRAAEIPVKLIQYDNEGNETRLTNHPALNLLEKPNDLQSYREFTEQALGFYLLTGNTFNYKVMSTTREDNIPIQMYILPSQYMDIKTSGSTNAGTEPIEYYSLNTVGTQKFEAENIIHLKTPNYVFDNGQWLYGLSPLKAALKSLNTSNSNQTALAKLAQNLGAIGLLMFDKSANQASASPTKGQLRQMQSFINKNIQGESNRGAIRAISQVFKWQGISLSASDLELIESSRMTARDIYSIYGLDSKLFNDPQASTYNNMIEAKKSAYTEAIIPTLKAWLNKLNDSIFPKGSNLYFKPDLSAIEVLKKDQTRLISALTNAYFIPNQVKQEMLGLEPDESMPKYLVPSSLVPVDNIGLEGEAQTQLNKIIELYQKKV